jgi:S1-C subfamily serine protease
MFKWLKWLARVLEFRTITLGLCILCTAIVAKHVTLLSAEMAYLAQGIRIIANNEDLINKNVLTTNNNVLEGIKTSIGLNQMMVNIMKAINEGSIDRDAKITVNIDTLFNSISTQIKLNKERDAYLKTIHNFVVSKAREQAQEEELNKREIENLKSFLLQQPDKARVERAQLEYKLMQCDIMLIDNIEGSQGSGITIKYNDKIYILSAAHLVGPEKQNLSLYENGNYICEVRVVKVDHDADLLLLETIDPEIQPRFWTTIAEQEPVKAEEVYVVGNPIGIEDVLSIARVISYRGSFFYYLDHSYFGSSGGGIFNLRGEVVGTISHLIPYDPNPYGIVKNRMPQFVIHGACRLRSIKFFLEDVK